MSRFTVIQPERIQPLNEQPVRSGRYVLYWMQASQRAECNHALEYAIRQANDRRQPLVAVFSITDRFPEANERHYAFMLEGLREVRAALRQRGIQLVVRHQSPDVAAIGLAGRASLVVADRGYLRIQKAWREDVARKAPCLVVQVESDVVVPVDVASRKEEYSAATLRPKIHRQLERFLQPLEPTPVGRDSLGLRFDQLDLADLGKVLRELKIDRSVKAVRVFEGGTSRAKQRLEEFIQADFRDYARRRSDPSLGIQSHMSPYLHFGHVSPVFIALRIRQAGAGCEEALEAYLEELIVRRELSMNFVNSNPNYDSYVALPGWAKVTLRRHRQDRRDPAYTLAELERARTHDPYWNAAMREVLVTGKMHNTMRMYWGKKIIEWTRTPEEAFRIALHLNNKYSLDGRDPNSFAGVAWCFGKHDRAWAERPLFGKVRYMNAAGLKRKFDIEAYVQWVEAFG